MIGEYTGGSSVVADIALSRIFYFCDYDGTGFIFELNNKVEISKYLYAYMEERVDPLFIALKHKDSKAYDKEKNIVIEYFNHRICSLELDRHSEQDFKNAAYYFKDVYFPRIDKL
jgi:hypothetical protein